MDVQDLGKTPLKVSRLCFGSLTLGPLQANLNLTQGAGLLRYGFERGINFVDTAQLYQTYPYIREALKGWAGEVFIASKSYDYTKEGMKKSLEEARKALNRDCIDIFMLHEQESLLTLEGHRPALDYLWEAKARGLVRAVGVSTHTIALVNAAADREDIEVIHPIVNYRGLGIVDGSLPEMLKALQKAWDKGKGIYGMKPLGGGHLIKEARKALEFVFQIPYLHSVAIGCQTREELEYNLCILQGEEPDPKLAERLNKKQRTLHIEEWCEGCGACATKCPFGLLEIKEGKAVLSGEGCVTCGYCASVCPQFAIKVY